MNDMTTVIAPRSDQSNFDDFVGGITKTIKITGVKVLGKGKEQPCIISYEGDEGKPWKPCKSMARILVHCWGAESKQYVGRSVTLYGDPNVVFGGSKVGGIRISHLSHISEPVTIPLTTTRSIRKPFTVKPLMGGEADRGDVSPPAATPELDAWLDDIAKCSTVDHLKLKFDASLKVFPDDDTRRKLIDAKDARKFLLTNTLGQ